MKLYIWYYNKMATIVNKEMNIRVAKVKLASDSSLYCWLTR